MARKHGMADTPMYKAWLVMVQRCTNPKNPKWPQYGGRGITVCDEWLKFENFHRDMGDRPDGHSLERKDVNKGYSKGNCVWADSITQANNTTRSARIEYDGDVMTYAQWARDVRAGGASAQTIRHRHVVRKWSFEKALTTPNLC